MDVKSVSIRIAEIYSVMEEVPASGGDFKLTVTGNSMFPFLSICGIRLCSPL